MSNATDMPSVSVIEQFQKIKRRDPDCLLMFRIGDFAELYEYDAERGSQILGISLTKRGGLKMAAFPWCVLQSKIELAMKSGVRVMIYEPVII